MPLWGKVTLLLTMSFLWSCSQAPIRNPMTGPAPKSIIEKPADDNDGPPDEEIDVTKIPNAVPKREPLSRYGNPASYSALGSRYYVLPSSQGYKAEGIASWYGLKFHGKRTSSGEPYDMFGMTAAHPSLPLPTYCKVKNLDNGREVIVKINDRGPFAKDRLIDLSYAAAKKLGLYAAGIGKVRVTAIDPDVFHKDKKEKDVKKAKKEDKQIYIQLGAFNKNNANSLTKTLTKLETKVVSNKVSNKDLYRVRVGPLKNEKEAQKLQKKLLVLNGVSTAKLVYE